MKQRLEATHFIEAYVGFGKYRYSPILPISELPNTFTAMLPPFKTIAIWNIKYK